MSYSYGERGWELLQKTLIEVFIKDAEPEYDLGEIERRPDQPLQALNAHAFIERVLMPELICLLIINDQKARLGDITVEQAKRLRDESTEYGIAMFPSKSMGSIKKSARSNTDSVFYDQEDDSDEEPSLFTKMATPPQSKKGPSNSINNTPLKPRNREKARTRTAISSSTSVVTPSKPKIRPRPSSTSLSQQKETDGGMEDNDTTIMPFHSQDSQLNEVVGLGQTAITSGYSRPISLDLTSFSPIPPRFNGHLQSSSYDCDTSSPEKTCKTRIEIGKGEYQRRDRGIEEARAWRSGARPPNDEL